MRQAAALGKLPTGPGGVGLVVIDQDGTEHPGWRLRAGDYVEATEYNHDTRVVFARVGAVPLPLRLRLRRWWEGWRRRQERWGG
jgi:hypothetical protein